MLSVLPPERVKDWDGDAGYDSELYEIGADYIVELQNKLQAIEAIIKDPDYKSFQWVEEQLRSILSDK